MNILKRWPDLAKCHYTVMIYSLTSIVVQPLIVNIMKHENALCMRIDVVGMGGFDLNHDTSTKSKKRQSGEVAALDMVEIQATQMKLDNVQTAM